MMRINIIAIVFFSILMVGCSSSKRVQSPPASLPPEWVSGRPATPTYYHGVGVARKTANINQYQQSARLNSLANLASEISVSISSNSVINAYDWNFNFREDFTSTIRTQTQQELEGYELVSTWEDAQNYWVYYRLSKAYHRELIERKMNGAIARSLDLFTIALDARDGGNVGVAIVQMVKALEPIKPYFSEPLTVDFRGSQIFLANEILKELSQTLSTLRLVPTTDQVTVKMGQGLTGSTLEFIGRYNNLDRVGELPLVATYSEKPIRNSRKRTEMEGRVRFEIDVVTSSRPTETLTAILDMDAIMLEATNDHMIRRMVSRFSPPQATIRIDVQKPVFMIYSDETNLGESLKPGILFESFKSKAIEGGYLVTDNPSDADYLVRINIVTTSMGESSGYKNVALEGNISVENPFGNRIYQKPLEGIRGRHFHENDAGFEAFREVRRRLEVTYFREIHEAITRR